MGRAVVGGAKEADSERVDAGTWLAAKHDDVCVFYYTTRSEKCPGGFWSAVPVFIDSAAPELSSHGGGVRHICVLCVIFERKSQHKSSLHRQLTTALSLFLDVSQTCFFFFYNRKKCYCASCGCLCVGVFCFCYN